MANDFIKMQPGRKFSPPKEEWFWKFWCWPILKSQPTVMFPSALLPAEWSLSPSQSQAPAPLSMSPRSKRSLSWVAKISQFWSSQFLRCSYHSCHDWSKFIFRIFSLCFLLQVYTDYTKNIFWVKSRAQNFPGCKVTEWYLSFKIFWCCDCCWFWFCLAACHERVFDWVIKNENWWPEFILNRCWGLSKDLHNFHQPNTFTGK